MENDVSPRSAHALRQNDPGVPRAELKATGSQTAALSLKLKQRDSYIETLKAQAENIPFLNSLIKDLEGTVAENEERLNEQQRRLAGCYAELAILTRALLEEEGRAELHQRDLEGLLGIVRAMSTRGRWWWSFMPYGWVRQRQAARLSRLGLFDARAYARDNPDIIEAGHDPFSHYILHGIEEIRSGKRRQIAF